LIEEGDAAMIQRYEMVQKTVCGEGWQELDRDADGDWCRYDEAEAEILALKEQIASLESREVCTVAHENVERCGYCQRDALKTVAEIAKELTQTAYETDAWHTAIDDRVLTALERALEAAGYGMTDAEMAQALQKEPSREMLEIPAFLRRGTD
jgi:hypothetical protein